MTSATRALLLDLSKKRRDKGDGHAWAYGKYSSHFRPLCFSTAKNETTFDTTILHIVVGAGSASEITEMIIRRRML